MKFLEVLDYFGVIYKTISLAITITSLVNLSRMEVTHDLYLLSLFRISSDLSTQPRRTLNFPLLFLTGTRWTYPHLDHTIWSRRISEEKNGEENFSLQPIVWQVVAEVNSWKESFQWVNSNIFMIQSASVCRIFRRKAVGRFTISFHRCNQNQDSCKKWLRCINLPLLVVRRGSCSHPSLIQRNLLFLGFQLAVH